MTSSRDLALNAVFKHRLFSTKELIQFSTISRSAKTCIRELIFKKLFVNLRSTSLTTLLHTIRSQPGLHLCVESLTLHGLPPRQHRSQRRIDVHVGADDIRRCISSLPRLYKVRLTYVEVWGDNVTPALDTPIVITLDLAHVIFDPPCTPFSFLASLGRASRLCMRSVAWYVDDERPSVMHSVSSAVEHLSIACSDLLPLDLHAMPTLVGLKSLTCTQVDDRVLIWLEDVISLNESSLAQVTVKLTPQYTVMPQAMWEQLDIPRLTNVDFFHVSLPLDFFQSDADKLEREQLLFAMLTNLPPQLSTLGITLDCSGWMTLQAVSNAIRALDWAMVGNTLHESHIVAIIVGVQTRPSCGTYLWQDVDIEWVKRRLGRAIMARELYLVNSDRDVDHI